VGRRSVSVADVLRAVLPPARRKRIFSLGLIRAKWVDVVGRELAIRSEPTSLGDRLLTVLVADAAWGRSILKLQRDIVSRVNRMVEPDLVRRIQFIRDGRRPWDSSPPAPLPDAGKPANAEASAPILEAAQAIADPTLRSRVIRTAARYLAAQERRRKQMDSNHKNTD
jgi:hypothetical protein